MIKEILGGRKKLIVKNSSKNIPSISTIREVYSKIPSDKKTPIVFESKEQYLTEYVKNQEKEKGKFPKRQVQQYKARELKDMGNIVSRYTTNHNPYIDKRTVFFTDRKWTPNEFRKSAEHEYGHELWEKNKAIRSDWKSVSKSTSPTAYGRTDKQEDFAESYMLMREGKLDDPRRAMIINKDTTARNVVLLPTGKDLFSQNRQITLAGAYARDIINKIQSGNPEGRIRQDKIQGMDEYFRKKKIDSDNTGQNAIRHTNIRFKQLFKDIGRNSISEAIDGTILPEEVLGSNEWKFYGFNKTYNPAFEHHDLKSNIMNIASQHYRALNASPANDRTSLNLDDPRPGVYGYAAGAPNNISALTNPDMIITGTYSKPRKMIITDIYSPNLSWKEVGEGLGKATARLAPSNVKRVWSGQQEQKYTPVDAAKSIGRTTTKAVTWIAKRPLVQKTGQAIGGALSKGLTYAAQTPAGKVIAIGAEGLGKAGRAVGSAAVATGQAIATSTPVTGFQTERERQKNYEAKLQAVEQIEKATQGQLSYGKPIQIPQITSVISQPQMTHTGVISKEDYESMLPGRPVGFTNQLAGVPGTEFALQNYMGGSTIPGRAYMPQPSLYLTKDIGGFK